MESLGFGFDRGDFTGLKRAILNAGKEDDEEESMTGNEPSSTGQPATAEMPPSEQPANDEEVQKIEGMMLKLLAVRDLSSGLPEDQRKRMAAKAVGEVMKDL